MTRREQRKRDRARRTRRPTSTSAVKGTIITSSHSEDSLFFPTMPKLELENIRDGPPKELHPFSRLTGEGATFKAQRMIYAKRKRRSVLGDPGFLIPVSHFKPFIQRMIERGEIDPSKVGETVEKLKVLTSRLLPNHRDFSTERYLEVLRTHGDHFSPLVTIRDKSGLCQDRAAVFVAMARAAGLEARIAGDPNFFERDRTGKGDAFHVWPVVRTGPGEMTPVHMFGEVPYDVDPARGEADRRFVERRVGSGNFPAYEEYIPTKPIVVPRNLRVNRPDVFGD